LDRGASSGLAVIGGLASSGESVLVVCADALSRRAIVENALHPDRYGTGDGAIVAARGSIARGVDAAWNVAAAGHEGRPRGLVLADWAALALAPGLASLFEHVVVTDPAPHPRLAALAGSGEGYLHLIATKRELALSALAAALPDRKELAATYRALRDPGESLAGEALRTALAGPGGAARSPESCALAVRVLTEIGVVRTDASGPATRVEAVSSVRGDLSSSMSFRLVENVHEECIRFLNHPEKPSSSPLEVAA